MAVLGLAAVFAGGCPLRQLILAGEGNGDALITVLGLAAGSIHAYFGLASSSYRSYRAWQDSRHHCSGIIDHSGGGVVPPN